MADLVEKARSEVASQAIPMDQITMKKMAHIRPEGAQQTLEVPFAAPQNMTAAFEAAHQQRFGFCPEDAVLLIDMLTAEAVGSTGETVKMPDMPRNQTPPQQAEMWSQGGISHGAPD